MNITLLERRVITEAAVFRTALFAEGMRDSERKVNFENGHRPGRPISP